MDPGAPQSPPTGRSRTVNAPRIITCVYCGQEYPQDTPPHSAEILTEHIKVCEKHPLRASEAKCAKLRKALIELVGAESAAELTIMEATIRMMPAPEADRAASINAIHALLETA